MRYRVLDPNGKDHVVVVDGDVVSGHENLAMCIPEDEPNRHLHKPRLVEHVVFAMQAGCKVAGTRFGEFQIERLQP